ncbi:cilia- and flagella-associated protein 251 [Rosa sericea]
MLKKLPSRNHRTKRIKVKHILQIALLLGVCFWLLYQLKHSHDKKVALDEKAAKASIRSLSEGELLKLGRKDLPHKDVSKNVKQEEEEEEETVGDEEEKHEVEGREEEDQKHEVEEREEEDLKHDVEEQEEEESKNDDTEDEGGAGDDEIDENEQERKEGKIDHEEDILDEEKEREDEGDEKDGDRNEREEREGRAENENSSDDQDNDGGDKNAHEAQEEHYKGDDASSAVTHDAQVISTETEKVSSESGNENSGSSSLEKEIKSNYAEDVNGNQNNSRLLDGSTAENGTVSVAASEEKVDENLSNPVDSSVLNATMKVQSDDIPEADNNSTNLSTESSNNSLEVNQANGTETVSVSAHSQNGTLDGMTTREGIAGETLVVEQTNNTISDNYHSDSNSTVSSNKVESNVSEKIARSNGTAQLEDDSRSSTINESMDAAKNEELKNEDANKNEETKNEEATKNKELNGTSESGKTGNSSDSRNGAEDAVQHDPIDSSDSLVSEDKKEARTDLDTSPEMKTEGNENGQAAAE